MNDRDEAPKNQREHEMKVKWQQKILIFEVNILL